MIKKSFYGDKIYDSRNGDYTQEHHQWLDELTINDILNDIQIRQEIIKED